MITPSSTFAAPWAPLLRTLSLGVATVLVGVVVLDATVFPPHLLGGWSWLLTRILPLSILFACIWS